MEDSQKHPVENSLDSDCEKETEFVSVDVDKVENDFELVDEKLASVPEDNEFKGEKNQSEFTGEQMFSEGKADFGFRDEDVVGQVDDVVSGKDNSDSLLAEAKAKVEDVVGDIKPRVEQVQSGFIGEQVSSGVKADFGFRDEDVVGQVDDVVSGKDNSDSLLAEAKAKVEDIVGDVKVKADNVIVEVESEVDVVVAEAKAKVEDVVGDIKPRVEQTKLESNDEQLTDKTQEFIKILDPETKYTEPKTSQDTFTGIISSVKPDEKKHKSELSRRLLRQLRAEAEKEKNQEKENIEQTHEFSFTDSSNTNFIKEVNTNTQSTTGIDVIADSDIKTVEDKEKQISEKLLTENIEQKIDEEEVFVEPVKQTAYEEQKISEPENKVDNSLRFEAPIEINETESTIVRRKSLLGQTKQENDENYDENHVRLAWQPLKQEPEKTEEEKLETILEGATVYPTLPSRAPAHLWSILLGLLMLPTTWFFMNDGISRLTSTKVSNSFVSFGTIEIAIAAIALIVFLIATQFSSLGTFIMGSLITVLGIPFLFFPGATKSFFAEFKYRAENIGGFVETLANYFLDNGYQGIFFYFGILFFVLGFVSHTARRLGRREQQIRNDLGLVGVDDRIAKKAKKAAIKAEMAEEKAKMNKRRR